MSTSRLSKTFKTWLPFAVTGAALVLLVSVSVQQNYRQSANDPQIQIAEDAASALQNGATPQSVVPIQTVDVSASLAPFLIITDANGTVLASTAKLNEKIPMPPSGTLAAAKNENRFTWQPQDGVRLATVVRYYTGTNPGYVIAGRNLREVEIRESQLEDIALLDLIGLLAGTFLVIYWTKKD